MAMKLRSVRKGLSKTNPDIITGIDIGASKVACCIARVDTSGELQILGTGYHASRGLQGGAIVDMKALQKAIASAVHGAEETADLTVTHAYVSLSPALTTSSTIEVEASITGHAVDDHDVGKMVAQACQAAEKPGHDIIHTISTGYSIDGTRGIRDPRGMFGDALSGKVHIISGVSGPLRNLSVCVEHCHLNTTGFVVSPLASGLSTLVEDEIDLGVTLVDMGAGATSIGTFYDGKLSFVDSVGFGGMHVTNDIARGLSTPLAQAERIKTLYGSAVPSSKDDQQTIVIPQIGEETSEKGPQVSKAELLQIIQPRLEETFEMVRERLKNSAANQGVGKRLVLTGGASQLAGVKELAGYVLDKQVRMGKPLHLQGLQERAHGPDFSTCTGLVIYGRDELLEEQAHHGRGRFGVSNLFGRLGGWLRQNA